jgi:hypothetical protein
MNKIINERPELEIVGEDGNAFSILAKARHVAKENGWSKEKIDEFITKATSSDYDSLLQTCMEYFEVY